MASDADEGTMAAGIVTALEIYGLAGLAVAALFLAWGIDRVDGNARGAFVFRPLLIPGVALLWPLVLWRWVSLERGGDRWGARHRPPRRLQDWLGLALSAAIPVILFGALLVRQNGPFERPAELLEPPPAAAEAESDR